MASPRQLERFPNLVAMFATRARELGDAPFLWSKAEGEWRSLSWSEAARQVAALATALGEIGLRRGDHVMLVSENRPEWCIADLAIMAAGCVTVPTYTTNTERDHAHILENSCARAVIVSTQKLARAVLPAAVRSSRCRTIIGIEPLRIGTGGLDVRDWGALIVTESPDLQEIVASLDQGREDMACIIYTSGTGGAPRGVMLSHGALLSNCESCTRLFSEDFGWGNDEAFVSFLPLSHAFEHTGGQFFPIGLGAQIYYAESLEKLGANIEEARPTVMVIVPRLVEVMRQRLLKAVEKQGRLTNYLMRRAIEIGEKDYAGNTSLADKPMDLLLGFTLRSKVRKRFGGRLKALVAGGAPLNPEIGVFFHSLGITLLQGYGQTEAAPVVSCNRPSVGLKMDTVGPPLHDVEVRIAEDGEILVRGELVMLGYFRNEDETRRTLREGWLHTGDIGRFDEDGRLVITDRKKDIIVNDKGDNIAPQRVEGMLTLEPEILQAMVVGDRRPHLVGLVVPDPDWASEWADERGKPGEVRALLEDAEFGRAINAAVDRVNRGLAPLEKVRRVILADEAFTIENEQMTPSLKIRRHVLKEKYGPQLDALYRR